MKKFLNFLFSFPVMGFLVLVMAFSMAIATFIESSYGTEAAKGLIYNSTWFELVMILLGANLLANFIRFKMYRKERIAVGTFHIAFIVILIGAGITRYISFEGMMHIRQGQSSDYIMSSDDYLTLKSPGETVSKSVILSELSYRGFNEKISVEGKTVRVKTVGFIQDAIRTVTDDPSGPAMIDFVVSEGQGRENYVFQQGNRVMLGNLQLGFDAPGSNFQFFSRGDSLLMVSDRQVEIRSMTGGAPVIIQPNDTVAVQPMHLYAFDSYLLLVKKFYAHGKMTIAKDTSGKANQDAVVLEVDDGSSKQTVDVMGRHGQEGEPFNVPVGNANLQITYGSEPIYLPFSLQLVKFEMDKYPGSMSPSSFASEIVLKDGQRNVTRNVRIFMNNTLNYRGYKFFQSSYDQDEMGTVLSVNADALGTTVTYIGYLLLGLGFVLALISKHSRFRMLINRLKQYSKATAILVFVLLGMNVHSASAANSEIAGIPRMDKTMLDDFSRLWIQGLDDRIEPVSTLASEILRKVSRKSSFYGMPPEEVMLGLYVYPEQWERVALVKVSNPQVKSLLNISDDRVPLTVFFDDKGQYKLLDQVKAAYAKAPAMRNMFEKDLIDVDERVNICFMLINGDMFHLFPGPTKADKWFAPGDKPVGIPKADSLFVNRGFELFKESFTSKGGITGEQILNSIGAYQKKYASDYLPSESRKNVEIFYNSLNPFKRVFPIYLLLGFVLLTILIVNIFRQKPMSKKVVLVFTILIGLGFLLHTFGLALRWYVSGHAPWSNGYESMVYVAWAAMLAGVIFGRKYPMVLGTAAMLSGIILFVAHLNWMNPEITHLVPVLNSYWLMIHVAIITASYGFIGLSAFLGLLVLVLISFSSSKENKNVVNIIMQLTTINEMSVTVGLYMLTIGTFLGGVWANESWGRYWGWDPKETWALISVAVYTFVAHMRLIPSLKGVYNYTVASVLGFSSIIMTYFGVNYFLSGMHSYGRGSITSFHWSVYVVLAAVAALLILSVFRHKHLDLENSK